jgi:hypothetical protein
VNFPTRHSALDATASDVGLSVLDPVPGTPFSFFGRASELKVSLESCVEWASGYLLPEGRLIVLTDLEVKTPKVPAIIRRMSSDCSRAGLIHAAVANASGKDVLLMVSQKDSAGTSSELSDLAELRRALSGIDLPGCYCDHSEI